MGFGQSSIYRKGGLVALMTVACVFSHPAPQAYAQVIDTAALTQGNIGQNITTALQGGVNPTQLANALGGANLQGMITPQLLGTLQQQLQSGGINAGSAAQLISATAMGALPPELTQGLAAIQNFGNLAGNAQGIAALLPPEILAGINALSPIQQGFALDQILASGIAGGAGGVDPAALAGVLPQLPAVMDALASGNPTSLLGAVTGLLGGSGGGGGGFLGLLGGGGSSSGGSSTSSSSSSSSSSGGSSSSSGGTGRTEDTGNYEIENPQDINEGPAVYSCPACRSQAVQIKNDHIRIRQHVHDEFIKHRTWIVNEFWKEHVLPAMMLMAEQLTAVGIQQVQMVGAMLDAKHQLETQQLFQKMTAQAHKDYQPSEGMCTFGTTVRNLSASERKSDLVQVGLAGRMMQRQIMSGDTIGVEGEDTDIRSRMHIFTQTYCDRADNINGLSRLCEDNNSAPERKNIDVDYTRNIETRLTLDMDFTDSADDDDAQDKEDVMALAANLYSHNIAPRIKPEDLGDGEGVRTGAAGLYMKLRANYAKSAVAKNSFAAQTALRASGLRGTDEGSAAPYIKALMRELGVTDAEDIDKFLGKNPSYFAQMEVLTKKLYQNPTFYTELYDKPVNVERKGAAIQAISLMQDRDLYNSLLRSEAVLSVLLETMLMKEQERVESAKEFSSPGRASGGGASGGGGGGF